MKYMSVQQLAEGTRERHVSAERARLTEKWSRTGLLRGLDGHKRGVMAQLLENQAAQVLRESNAISTGGGNVTSSGQIQGFSNVAFPIVRRVFGGLVANELVSVQPMSLPSGLIFYLDYTYGSNVGGDAGMGLSNAATKDTYQRGQSIYSNPAGKGVQSGSLAAGGMYDLMNTGYTRVHASASTVSGSNALIGAWTTVSGVTSFTPAATVATSADFTGVNARALGFDSQVETDVALGNLDVAFVHLEVAALKAALPKADLGSIDQLAVFGFATAGGTVEWGDAYQSGKGVLNLRRLNRRGNFAGGVFTPNHMNGTHVQLVVRLTDGGAVPGAGTAAQVVSMALMDAMEVDTGSGAVTTIPSFETDFGAQPLAAIPEIDIKIESIAITATTRKLRARWSPEMAQDLNAYHSIDAEVELTGILSEQISLEIDRGVLNELVAGANGANLFWSRAPGKFVNKYTGAPADLESSLSTGPQFTGTVADWYQTLIETVIDAANTIHRKTLRGSANFLVTSPDVCTILESSILYKPKFSLDGEGQVSAPFTVGAEAVGTVSNRFTVYKDPFFPRNKILVGYKGGSYLETGYVYAPYIPLIVTPTIFAAEDFTPRKGVMTRVGQKMVRSDFYAVVTVTDMHII